MPTALISGITGQDGSYLADLLLSKGYTVHGIVRRSSQYNWDRINHIKEHITLHYGDLNDSGSLRRILDKAKPGEVYNLGAMSHVRVSFDIPEETANITATGTIRMLEAIRESNPNIRYYQASSSEMFGSSPPPQNELTPFHPRSPYGCAKVFAYWATVNYRESYRMHCSNGILFNHESPRRGENFVTRKITRAVARIKKKLQQTLELGNIEAKRDWGHAKDYVEAQWQILQRFTPDDYVIATGETHSVREFLQEAFDYVGLKWEDFVRINPKFFRPAEVDVLLGDPTKAQNALGWKPKISFRQLVHEMVDHDIHALERDLASDLKGISQIVENYNA